MTQLKGDCLKNAYDWYVGWLEEWWYTKNWESKFPEMVLWYAVAGSAVGGDGAAYSILEKAKSGDTTIPKKSEKTWQEARALSIKICRDMKTNPVDWFTGGCEPLDKAWSTLDDIHNIGPKIASFILRDLSFMRDYSKGLGGKSVAWQETQDTKWFEVLPFDDQALFIPIDRRVYDEAKRNKASALFKKYDLSTVQGDRALYRGAATDFVSWCRNSGFDPRIVDVYWYGTGSGKIGENGTEL